MGTEKERDAEGDTWQNRDQRHGTCVARLEKERWRAAMQHGRGGDAENRRGGDTGVGGEPSAKGDHSQDRVRHRQGQGDGRP